MTDGAAGKNLANASGASAGDQATDTDLAESADLSGPGAKSTTRRRGKARPAAAKTPSAASSVADIPVAPKTRPGQSTSDSTTRIPRQPGPATPTATPAVVKASPPAKTAAPPSAKTAASPSATSAASPSNVVTARTGTTDVLVTGPDKAKPPAKTGDTAKLDVTSVEIVVERAPADWQNFAPEHLHPDTLVRRAGRHVLRPLRFLGHEWTLTVLGGLALSVLLNYAALRDMMHTLPKDVGDPSLVAYLMAWDGFALLHRPADLWQTNAFFPGTYTLGYTDAFLGYAPFALIGTGIAAAVLRYNIVFILAQALAFIGAYALVRQLGAVRVAAAAAAVAFAVAPWRLGAAGHLQVLSTGGIALSLAMLARAHGVRWRTAPARSSGESRPPVRPGWAAAGWLCAAWQITIGFAVGLVFAYVLAGAAVVGLIWWLARSRRMPSWWLLAVDGIGAIVFAAVCFLLARPYGKVVDLYPSAARTDDWIAQHSTPLRGFFTAPESSLVWGDVHAPSRALLSMPNDMALLPGFALLAFAVAGIAFSVWRWPVRLLLALGVVATAALAMGTHGPDGGKAGYLFLLHNVPGFDGLPTPGYLIIWTTLLLAVLAAGSVAALAARSGEVALRLGLPRPTAMARFALLLPFILVLAEGIGTTPQVKVPPVPAAVARADAPLLVLPSTDNLDKLVMLWTTTSFEDVVNGGSGFVPTELANARDQVKQFPDPGSVDYLRGLGVKTVVVLPDLAKGTPWEASATAEIDDLGISRDVASDAITFHLDS